MMTPWCLTHRSPTQGRYLAPRWTTLQSHRTFRLSPFTRQIERGCASAAVVPVSRKWRISRRVRWTAPRSRIAPLPWGGISSFGPTYLQKKKKNVPKVPAPLWPSTKLQIFQHRKVQLLLSTPGLCAALASKRSQPNRCRFSPGFFYSSRNTS